MRFLMLILVALNSSYFVEWIPNNATSSPAPAPDPSPRGEWPWQL